MKISLVIYNTDKKNLDKFITNILKSYTIEFFELIIIYKTEDNIDSTIYKFKKFTDKGRIKFVMTTCENKFKSLINTGITYATGEYLMFLSSSDKIDKKYLEYLYNNVSSTNIDIFEFGFKLRGNIDLDYVAPEFVDSGYIYDLKNSFNVFAGISPLSVNKVYRTSLVKDILSKNVFPLKELIFNLTFIAIANTYLYSDKTGITHYKTTEVNVEDCISQWEYILFFYKNYSDWSNIAESIEYSYISYLVKILLYGRNQQDLSEKFNSDSDKIKYKVSEIISKVKFNYLIKTDKKFNKIIDKLLSNQLQTNTISSPVAKNDNPFKIIKLLRKGTPK